MKDKKVCIVSVDCPHCLKPLEVWKEVKTIVPATKAEKEEKYSVSKGLQSKL